MKYGMIDWNGNILSVFNSKEAKAQAKNDQPHRYVVKFKSSGWRIGDVIPGPQCIDHTWTA